MRRLERSIMHFLTRWTNIEIPGSVPIKYQVTSSPAGAPRGAEGPKGAFGQSQTQQSCVWDYKENKYLFSLASRPRWINISEVRSGHYGNEKGNYRRLQDSKDCN